MGSSASLSVEHTVDAAKATKLQGTTAVSGALRVKVGGLASTTFPEANSIVWVIYGVLLWADMNASAIHPRVGALPSVLGRHGEFGHNATRGGKVGGVRGVVRFGRSLYALPPLLLDDGHDV